MGRARKDSTGSNPVEYYRKQIGKQDVKKSKDHLRDSKNKADMKENAPAIYKDIFLMLGVLIIVFVCIYFVFYAALFETNK